MSNVVHLKPPAKAHVGAAFLADPPAHSHAVQFYEDDAFLVHTVGQFLAAGLRGDERVLVVATPEHRAAFLKALREQGVGEVGGRLRMLDARETLAKFVIDGMPDADLFHDLLSGELASLRGDSSTTRIRAYGEMVDLLWRDGNTTAAIRLEELWNEASENHEFRLLCAYVMNNFLKDASGEQFFEVCRTHSHVMPTERFAQLDDAHARLREISVLQQRAQALENEIRHRKDLEAALRDALRTRGRVEEELRRAVKSERAARARAEASDQFKEMFISILGHDLRNPLSTILTTTRLMMLRIGTSTEDKKRLIRIVTSGERIQRMIEQLLDVTRARLGGGILVESAAEHDLGPIVERIVDELRTSHPDRDIAYSCEEPCVAAVDTDRFEQVVSNLVGNALTHGDRTRPVAVVLTPRTDGASLSVHNFGAPIEPALMPVLFDPFRRGQDKYGRSDGLGLGLYIVERIVAAHGGKIEVMSSAPAGTTFEVVLPRVR